MSDLFDLFGSRVSGPVGAPYTSNSDTSREAAESVAEVAGRLRRKVYEHIVASGDSGTTDDAAEVLLEMKHTTYTARRGELVKQGLVRDSGGRGKTRSGRNAVLWVAVPEHEIEQAKEEYKATEKQRKLQREVMDIIKTWDTDQLESFLRRQDAMTWRNV